MGMIAVPVLLFLSWTIPAVLEPVLIVSCASVSEAALFLGSTGVW